MPGPRRRFRLLRYIWAFPTTSVGLVAGILTLCSKGRMQFREGAIEFHGGFSRWLADRRRFSAMTLGHVIIGKDEWALDFCREHEQAHVRQVERWGFAFIPAYLTASVMAWSRGEHYYYDNWFERDARQACGEESSPRVRRKDSATSSGKRRPHHHDQTPGISPTTVNRHSEQHFRGSDLVRDIVIGMSDGLTVPFALAAGLSGTDIGTSLIVTAGLAEVAAGSIAMGLGGYLAAKTEHEHYDGERRREEAEVREVPAREAEEVSEVFQEYGLTDAEISPILDAFRRNPKAWVDFMMRFELGLEKPDASRAIRSALTIAGSYITGGLLPLIPYMLAQRAHDGLIASAIVTLAALAIFGGIKGRFTGVPALRSAVQTTLIGGIAASAAFAIARMFN